MSDLAEDFSRLYQEAILRHSRSPRHAQRPARIDASGVGDNPMCGDHVEVFVGWNSEHAIGEIGFEANGCAISIASADLMAERLRGTAPHAAREVAEAFGRMIQTGKDPDGSLEILHPFSGMADYPARRQCATLPWQALLQALDQSA